MLDRERIRSCVAQLGHNARLTEAGSKLTVGFDVGGRTVTLVHTFPDELLRLPKFNLAGGQGFARFAHVLSDGNDYSGEVCVADTTSTAVNTDLPELAYRDTVEKHVRLLTRLIEDPEYNRVEQLREFEAHWEILCRDMPKERAELFVVWDGREVAGLQVKQPRVTSGPDLRTAHIAFADAKEPASVVATADWASRRTVGKALALPLSRVEPAPATLEELPAWYFRAVRQADNAGRRELRRLQKKNVRDYWLVFSAPVPDGETMFAIRWHSRSVGPLPASIVAAETRGWMARPLRVRSLSRHSLVPRGGGSLDLATRSVLLVGCGSIGGELALRMASAGVGRLTVSDHDRFLEENLYRHVLSVPDIGRFKSEALAGRIEQQYPWADVTPWDRRLEDLRDPAVLQRFDLVVIAIGSPTVERVFAEYCRREAVAVPMINCWLEGFGIGGHGILAIPGEKGCWHCAYVDPQTLTRGLSSNLNFLQPGQVVMRNQGGCGTQFLPFSGIAASRTATMASDLAVRLLSGEVATSSKVSWKGCDAEATRATLKFTRRYRRFDESLRVLPLHDPNCDLCEG